MRVDEQRVEALVKEYIDQTLACSFYTAMSRAPAWMSLMSAGQAAVPALLRSLEAGEGGMQVMHLLGDITKVWPEYEQVADPVAPGWVGFRVDDARSAWLRWGREQGLLNVPDVEG